MPSHSIFESTSHGSLGSKIFILLRDRILNESYKCGDKLNELTLAEISGPIPSPGISTAFIRNLLLVL